MPASVKTAPYPPTFIGLDSGRAIFAANIAIATVIALYFAFLIELNHTFWALLTLPFVLQNQSGLTVWRSLARFNGAVIGAGIGLLLLSVFPQDPTTLMFALALCIMMTGMLARFQAGSDAYAYSIAGVTALTVVLDTGPDVALGFNLAVARATETLIPIIAGFVVILVVFPQSIVPVVRANIGQARAKVFAILRQAIALDAAPTSVARKEAAQALRMTLSNLRAWRFETAPGKGPLPQLLTMTYHLDKVMVSAETVSLALGHYRDDALPPDDVAAARDRLLALIDQLPEGETTAVAALSRAEALEAFADEADDGIAVDLAMSDTDMELHAATAALFRMRELSVSLAAMSRAEAAAMDFDLPHEPLRPDRTRHVDLMDAFQLGARPAILFFLLAMFWFWSAWSSAMILALIATILSLQLPTLAPRALLPIAGKLLASGMIAMAPIVVLLLAVLPSMESFMGLAATLGAVVFVFFYICGTPQTRPIAYGGIIILAVGLQPANVQVYSILSFVTVLVTLLLVPVIFTVGVLVIFPGTQARIRGHVRRGTGLLLGKARRGSLTAPEYLAQNTDLLGDYGGDLNLNDPANRQMIDRARAATQAGFELFAVRGLRSSIPDAEMVLADAVLAASRRSRAEESFADLDDVNRICAAATARLDQASQPEKRALVRLIMASRLIVALIESRSLALPETTR